MQRLYGEIVVVLQTNSECNCIAIDRIIVFEKWRCLLASKDGKAFTENSAVNP
jgi:hypothetical protein